jgi:2-oxoisovalerate dehydrogenase E1 component alpha subunit
MDSEGKIVDESYKRDFTDEEAVKLYETMVGVSIMDLICLDAQRQGRISFYMVSSGEVGFSFPRPRAIAYNHYRKASAWAPPPPSPSPT